MSPDGLGDRHVVVVGAGGLGCPALQALAEAGVGRITVLDPDRVEPSNLPRQVLFGPADVGREKAEVAARRVARPGTVARGIAARLGDGNEEAVLADADLVLDATDGARTKDWLNALAVYRRTPLVHAAALRSEGRLLVVPAGGRPCLACLFGRLGEDGGACADLGVWGGVVGATGYLAAAAALEVLWGRKPDDGYRVLDADGGRGIALPLAPAADCPVCRTPQTAPPEAPPVRATCGAEVDDAAAPAAAAGPLTAELDLRDESCPMNLLRARRAVEDLAEGGVLAIRLGAEGEESVPEGLRALGHRILSAEGPSGARRLLVRRGGDRPSRRLSRDRLLRFARQVVLPALGEAGQQRILDASVLLVGSGPAFETAATYLAAGGIGTLCIAGPDLEEVGRMIDRLADASEGSVEPARGEACDAVGFADAGPAAWPCRDTPPRWAFAVGAAGEGPGGAVRRLDDAAAQGPPASARGLGSAVRRALGALLADRLLRALGTGRVRHLDFALSPSGGFVHLPREPGP